MEAVFEKGISSGGFQVPTQQLENMGRRLRNIGPRAAKRRVRLKFLEHKVKTVFDLSE